MRYEPIYNIFLYFKDGVCSEVGFRVINSTGTDEQGIQYLRDHIEDHFANSTTFSLTRSFTLEEYNARVRLGTSAHLYDDLFSHLNAGPAPLSVVTAVNQGKLVVQYSSRFGEFDIDDANAAVGVKSKMIDWLKKYERPGGVALSELIHDDFFLAIKLTFNAGLYVSAMKLLLSCIDSVAYIEMGDVRRPPSFITWLDTYANLSSIGITAAELWELRNGILHMTNINSDRVRRNTVRRISFSVGDGAGLANHSEGGVFYFDFKGLIDVFAEAQGRWIETYNDDRSKFAKFVERYDQTISDSRCAFIHLGSTGSPLGAK